MEWILILYISVLTCDDNAATDIKVQSVNGFKSEQSCMVAGKKTAILDPEHIVFTCVQK